MLDSDEFSRHEKAARKGPGERTVRHPLAATLYPFFCAMAPPRLPGIRRAQAQLLLRRLWRQGPGTLLCSCWGDYAVVRPPS